MRAGNNIKNFKMDFRNGLIWCAILASHDKTCLDFASLKADSDADMLRNHALAFSVAEKRFGVDPLLDAEDMLEVAVPDQRSVLTYVSQMYKHMSTVPYTNPYFRDFEEAEFDAQRKKMEEARAEKEKLTRSPAPQPIVKGRSINASAGEIIPEGPCGKCQREHNYPQCKQYEASEIRKGKCLGCGHSPADHAGYVAEDGDRDVKPIETASAPAKLVDLEREERRRKAREEQEELDRQDAHRIGAQIDEAADSLTNFFSPAPVKATSLNSSANEKIPEGPCGKCQRENNYPQCMKYEQSKTRKGKCMGCMHSPLEHEGYVATKEAAKMCPVCNEQLSGTCAVFSGREMHKACFVCAGGCGKELAGKKGVVAVQGKPYCDLCSLKAFAAAQPKQAPANTEDRDRKARQAARREHRRELIELGVTLGIVPRPKADDAKRMEVLHAQMKRRKASRKAPVAEEPRRGEAKKEQPKQRDQEEERRQQRARADEEDERRERDKRREREKEDEQRQEREREERRKREQEEEALKERDREDRQRQRQRDEEAQLEREREERHKQREREREEETKRERDREDRAREREREEEARLDRDREERHKQREREKEEETRREREREDRARAREREDVAKQDREREERLRQREREKEEETQKEREREDRARRAREEEAKKEAEEKERRERDRARESSSSVSSRTSTAAASGEDDTTVDLSETNPEKLLAALLAKENGGAALSASEGRAKRRATAAIERKKEEDAFEREMEERKRAREERRRAREAAE